MHCRQWNYHGCCSHHPTHCSHVVWRCVASDPAARVCSLSWMRVRVSPCHAPLLPAVVDGGRSIAVMGNYSTWSLRSTRSAYAQDRCGTQQPCPKQPPLRSCGFRHVDGPCMRTSTVQAQFWHQLQQSAWVECGAVHTPACQRTLCLALLSICIPFTTPYLSSL
jgi:hypothetical protein